MRKLKLYQKIIFILLGIGIVFSLFTLNALFGNPLVKFIVTKKADNYLLENYSAFDTIRKEPFYNFKMAQYIVPIEVKGSEDSRFQVVYDSFGRFSYDTFEDRIFNTYTRFFEALSNYGKILKKKHNFPHELYLHIADELAVEKKLTLDEQVDFKNFPLPVEVHIVAFSEKKTLQKALDILKTTKNIMDETSLPVATYSLILVPEENRGKDGDVASYLNALSIYDIDPLMIKNSDLLGLKNLLAKQSLQESKD